MISVAVTGAAGRMGTAVWNAVQNDPGLELVGCIDPSAVGQLLGGHTVLASLDELDVTPEVVIDFTVAAAAVATMEWCVDHHVHVVVGTTGLDSAWLAGLGEKAHANGTGVLVAANFAIGAVLMMRLSEIAAPFFESVEIIEEHHNTKKDAPSGTALVTAERIAAVSGEWGSDPTEHELLPGARGATTAEGITIHSLRVKGLVAHQEVVFGTTGQTLRIRHDSLDRESFMPGIVRAAAWIPTHPGLTLGLESVLGL